MGIQVQLENGSLLGGGGLAFKGANAHLKPIDYGSIGGHYRTAVLLSMAVAQAAGSRLFVLRNPGPNWVLPLSVQVTTMPTGAVAVPYQFLLGLRRLTSFSAIDTGNVLTPSVSIVKTGMAAAPGAAQLRQSNGAAAGMTGGTFTGDSAYMGFHMNWAASVGATTRPVTSEMMKGPVDGGHPLICAQDQGFVIENVVPGSANANGMVVIINLAYAEVPANSY